MAFCSNCGSKLVDGAKFCQKCGAPVNDDNRGPTIKRQQEFVGKIYKCPNCGEVLQSFVRNCPSCGFEIRDVSVTSSIKEFAQKIEAIELHREYEKPRGIFTRDYAPDWIPKADEQKISLIHSFYVPNTKEDMLEFMILATSNLDTSLFGLTSTTNEKARKAVADAWLSKIKQVYAKAKTSYGNDNDFREIDELYHNCMAEIAKQKKKRTLKNLMLLGWLPMSWVILIIGSSFLARRYEAKEEDRLEAIVKEVEDAVESKNYGFALRNAESIEYNGEDKESERRWSIKKDTLIDEIIESAEKEGIHLERAP